MEDAQEAVMDVYELMGKSAWFCAVDINTRVVGRFMGRWSGRIDGDRFSFGYSNIPIMRPYYEAEIRNLYMVRGGLEAIRVDTEDFTDGNLIAESVVGYSNSRHFVSKYGVAKEVYPDLY